jgi:hypothetical protein
MEQVKKALYAALGSGDLAAERGRRLFERARSLTNDDRPDLRAAYQDLARRGEQVARRIRRSRPARRATEGTRQASRQLKGAVTSVRKALGVEEPKPATPKAG